MLTPGNWHKVCKCCYISGKIRNQRGNVKIQPRNGKEELATTQGKYLALRGAGLLFAEPKLINAGNSSACCQQTFLWIHTSFFVPSLGLQSSCFLAIHDWLRTQLNKKRPQGVIIPLPSSHSASIMLVERNTKPNARQSVY